ncbi:hypothetical protein WIS52_04955 [Pseudonocardia nematodicida]|uniref:Glycerophosphoryl diester phosphodiesterase membrane domain-containing protein n=1 Tax=Pseudonocardia nematodicida TaxID=1206997 RepID=A0ABV1K5R1_9PSEU
MVSPHASAPQDAEDPLVSGGFSDWLGKSIAVVRRSLVPLVVIQLCVFVPVAVVVGLLGGLGAFEDAEALAPRFGFEYSLATESAGVRLASIVFGALGLAASVFVVVRDAAGRAWSPGDVLGFAGRRFLPLIGWIVLSAILTVIGFLALVLPGIYLTVVFAGALTGAVVVERAGIGRAFALVNPRFFGVLGRLLALFLLSAAYSVVATLVGSVPALGAVPGDPALIVSQLLINLLLIPLTVFALAAAVVLYGELRARLEPGAGTTTFADELDRS